MAQTVNIPIQVDTSQAQQGLQTLTSQSRQLNQQLSAITNLTRGVVAGFTAVKAVTNLLGQENEDLAKSLVKVQAGMALVQSLGALAKGINSVNVAFRAFNTTLLANPLVAIATAVIAVSAAIAGLIVELSDNNKETNEATIAYNKYLDAIKEINEEQEYYIRLMRARGATQIEVDARLIADQENVIRLLKDAINTLEIYETTWVDTLFNTDKAISNAVNRNRISELTKQLDEENKKLIELNKDRNVTILKDLNDSIKLVDKAIKDSEQKRISDAKKAADEAQRQRKKIADEAKKILDKQIKDRDKAVERLSEFYEQQQADEEKLNTTGYERLELLDELYNENVRQINLLKSRIEDPDISPEAETNALLEILRLEQLQLDNRKEALDFEIQLDAEQERLNQASIDRAKAVSDAEDAAQKAILKARLYTYNQTAQIVGNSAKLFSDNTVAFKALSTASATISTYAGAAQVLAEPGLPLYARIAGVAATITTGLLMVKNIFDTDVPGASDTTSAPNIRTIPEIEPQITETHNNLNAYEEDLYNRTVLVVEDVNEVQNRLRVVENNSIF